MDSGRGAMELALHPICTAFRHGHRTFLLPRLFHKQVIHHNLFRSFEKCIFISL